MFKSIMAQVDQAARTCCCVVLRVYRCCISPFISPRCRFWPSCSAYATQVLQQRALFPALLLIVRRLLKCHPWHAGGCDLPPEQPSKDIAHV